jgi:glycosyltransferase involved in cell wall biosynthesis
MRSWKTWSRMDGAGSAADTLILVNSGATGALGERARWVARATSAGAAIVYRDHGRGDAIWRFLRDLRSRRPRVVYLVDAATATVTAGLWARRLGARVVLDTGDAIGALTRSTGTLGALGAAGAPWLERLAYALADTIVVRSDGLAQHVRSMSCRPVVVGPDGYDPSAAGELDGAAERRRWSITEEQTVLGVVGSAHWNARLRWCYGRDVVEAVAAARRPDVVGLVLVRGDGLPHLRSLARDRGVQDRVLFDDPGSATQTWQRLAAMDVALSTQTNDLVGQSRTTGKLIQYMAAGRYILASRVGAAATLLPAQMLVDYHGPWDEGYFTRLAERVTALPDRRRLAEQGGRLREVAVPFAYPRLVETLRASVFGAP